MHNIFPVNQPIEPDLSFLDYQSEYQATRKSRPSNLLSLTELYALDRTPHFFPIPAYDTESEHRFIQPTLDETIQTSNRLELFYLAVMAVAVEITAGRMHPKDRYCDRQGHFLTLDELKEVELVHEPGRLNNTLYHYLRQTHRHLHQVMKGDIPDLPNPPLFHLYRDCLWAAYRLLAMFYGDEVNQFMVKSMLTTLLNQKKPHTLRQAICEKRGQRDFGRYLKGLPK